MMLPIYCINIKYACQRLSLSAPSSSKALKSPTRGDLLHRQSCGKNLEVKFHSEVVSFWFQYAVKIVLFLIHFL